MGALGRTARRLKAGLAALFLIALAAVFAPRDARASAALTVEVGPGLGQVTLNYSASVSGAIIRWDHYQRTASGSYGNSITIPDSNAKVSGSHIVSGLTAGETYYFKADVHFNQGGGTGLWIATPEVSVTLPAVALTVNGGDRAFYFTWEYSGTTEGAVSWQLEWIRLSDRNGEGRWLDLPGGVALRKYSYSATNGETGIFRVRLVGPGGRTTIASSTVNNQGWIEATPRAATPTLVSAASRTLTVTPGGTVNACFNLLSVTAGDTTYLESRPGQTAVAEHAALSHGAHGVRISGNVDGVRTGVGQNLYPCAALGVGVHTVRWHWKGHDGTAETEASTSTTFTVVQVPDRTKDLSANPVSGKPSEIFLRWRDPIESGITWEYQYKEGAGSYGAWTAASLQSTGIPDTLGTTVTGLKPGTTYTFQVRARNDGGAGAASAEESATTEAPLVPAAPAGFAASAGNAKVWLTWTDPEDAGITGWEYQQKAGTGPYGSWTAVSGSTATTTHTEVTSLTNDTAYAFKLRAVSDAGNGTASAEQTATPGTAVAAVLTGAAGADGAHDLTWTTTSGGPHRIVNNANHIGLWYAYYRARGRTTWGGPSYTGGAGTRKWSTSGSPHGAVFEYRVQPAGSRIIAGLGSFNWNGPESNVIELTVNKPDSPALTFADAPVTVSPGQTATYTVKLNQAFAGTLALSSSAAGKARVSPSSLTFTDADYNVPKTVTVTGVAAGTATINHAFTLSGASKTFIPDAGTVSVTVGSGGGRVPAKPTVFAAAAGDGQAVLSWTNPNNASITGYKLRYGKTGARGSATWAAIPSSGATTAAHTVTGLDNDAEYSFKLRAVNSAGDGAATDWVTATPSSTPAALAKPAKPALTAAAGDGSVALSWSAQTDIANWGYQYKSSGGWSATRTVSDGSATSTVVTGLTNGTAYTFRLFARRGSGASAVQSVWSDQATATPVGVVVSKSALTVAEGASGNYTVKLSTAPSSNVTVTVGGASGDVTASPPSLTFTTTNYSTAQTVTVSAAQDPDGDADPDVTLSHSASGGGYGSVSIDDVVVTVTEDDTKGATVSSGALTVDEGGTGSYTVKLDTQPSGEVVVTVGGASGDVTVPDSQLRFAVNNWSEAQTVTVNAALDADADADPDVTLTHSAAGGGYGSVSIANVVVSVTESVSLPAAPTGFAATAGNGQVVLSWSNPGDASITGYELRRGKTGVRASAAWTAIPGAGATTTTRTVTGLDNGSEYSFRLRAVNPAGNGAETGWATATPLTPTVPGATVSTAALRLAEGGSGAYTVRLDTAPSADVTIAVGGASGDVTVSGSPLTFTAANWFTPQTVTVNAGTDTDTNTDPDVTLTHSASGGGYGSASIASVAVSVVEKDAAPAKPTGLAGAPGDGSATLTWTDLANPTVAKWQYRQKAGGGAWGEWRDIPGSGAGTTRHEVSGLRGGVAYQFEVRAVNAAGPGAGPDAPARVTPTGASPHAPRRGRATVTPTALTVAEGGSGSYAVVLGARPSSEVTVAISGASGDVSASPPQLVFTRSNWSESQTVTVTAAEDDDAEAEPTVTLSHAAAGGGYGSVSIDDVEVTVTENDVKGATLSTAALSVPEGGSAEYALTLDSQPSGEVAVAVSGASGDVTASPSRLMFTPANWNKPQTVTVTAAEDDDAEADPATTLSHSASGGGYGSVSIGAVTVAVAENDARGATLSTAALTVPEGGFAEYAATLDSQPSGDVTVAISGASGDVTVSPSRLIFTPANWSAPQTVAVLAAEDDDAEADPAVTLSHAAAGGGYGAVSIGAVTVTVTENDIRGATLSAAALTVPEGGSAEYALTLDGRPSGDVAVEVSGASGDVGVSPPRLVFTRSNWSEPQTVTVTAAEDDDADPDPTVTLSHAAAGGGYDAVSIGAVAVTVTENDTRGATLSKDALTVPEGGSGAYALTLDSQPSGEVAIEVSGASGDVTVSPSRLIFTGANWSEPQTVTVSAARDDDADADPAVALSHSAAGGGYDAVAIGSVRVSVTENYSAAREAARKRDAVNRAVLPQVLAALGSSSAVKERVEAGGISGASGASSASGSSGAAARFGAFLQSFAGRGNVSGLGAGPAAGAFPGSGVDLRAWTADPRAAARSGLGGGRLFAGAAAASGPNAAGSHPGGPLGGPLGSGGSLGSGSAGWGPGGSVGPVGSSSVGPAGSSSVGPAGSAGSVPPGSNPPGAARGPRSALSRLGESLFDGAGFALPLAAGGGSDLASTATVWGRGEQTSFAGSEAGARWDGRLWTAHLGADFRARPDVLVGAAVSHSRSETDVGAGFESVYETELTSLSPYAARLLADGSNLWASASYGAGEARAALRDAASPAADLTVARAEAGGRRVLAALPDWIAGGVTRFSVKGEGSLSRATTGAELGLGELTVDASRLRLALEGSHERILAGGGVLEPAVEAGLRYDGGDVAAGAGLEIGASLGWRDPGAGLTAEFRGRALATHERDRDEWGLSALLRIDPSADGLGGFLTLAPSWGATETGVARLFDAAPASAFANGGAPLPPRARMEAEYGYGFGVARRGALAVLSPYARLGLGEAGERTLRFGAKYLLESAFSFEFELERREDELLAPAQRFMLRGEYRW